MPKKLTTEEFIEKARKVHGDKYDYSNVKYTDSLTKVCIICNRCGREFWQTPANHLRGQGCAHCNKSKPSNKDEFVRKSIEVHGNKYDYSLVEYINSCTKVKIICPKHGVFEQNPAAHVNGQGCMYCRKTRRYNKEEFIRRAKIVHGDKYDYSLVKYIYNYIKVKIICPIHGVFEQTPAEHLYGSGCHKCRASCGEKKINDYLKQNNIEYKAQYPIKLEQQMFSRNNLKIDFYLPKYNTFIEFNGEQHYKRIPYFHKSEDDFQMQVERDKRLKDYCKKNKIKLIVIKYNQINKIEKILNKELTK